MSHLTFNFSCWDNIFKNKIYKVLWKLHFYSCIWQILFLMLLFLSMKIPSFSPSNLSLLSGLAALLIYCSCFFFWASFPTKQKQLPFYLLTESLRLQCLEFTFNSVFNPLHFIMFTDVTPNISSSVSAHFKFSLFSLCQRFVVIRYSFDSFQIYPGPVFLVWLLFPFCFL